MAHQTWAMWLVGWRQGWCQMVHCRGPNCTPGGIGRELAERDWSAVSLAHQAEFERRWQTRQDAPISLVHKLFPSMVSAKSKWCRPFQAVKEVIKLVGPPAISALLRNRLNNDKCRQWLAKIMGMQADVSLCCNEHYAPWDAHHWVGDNDCTLEPRISKGFPRDVKYLKPVDFGISLMGFPDFYILWTLRIHHPQLGHSPCDSPESLGPMCLQRQSNSNHPSQQPNLPKPNLHTPHWI